MKRAWASLKGFFKRRHRLLYTIIVIIVVLVGLRIALPAIIRHYVNKQLQKSATYAGSVGDIGVSLWRGAYQIHNIKISKRNGKVNVPFFSAPFMNLSLQWDALFDHRIVAEIYMEQPQLNFVKGPTPEKTQAGENTHWNQMLEDLTPFEINKLTVHNGQIHYKDDYSDPKVDVYFNELGVSATNLSNIRNKKIELPAGIRANAKTIGNGSMYFHLQFNPTAPAPEYQLQASLTNVDLPALNNFLEAYGKFRVANGDFAMFTSVAATNKAYDGYVKIFFNHLDVFSWKEAHEENILQMFWEAVIGAVTTVFKNQPQDQLATKIPISGVYTNSSVDLMTTIGKLLQNAFIHALLPKFDQKVTTGEVTKKVKNGEIPNANTNGAPETNNPSGGTGTNAPSQGRENRRSENSNNSSLQTNAVLITITNQPATNAPQNSPPSQMLVPSPTVPVPIIDGTNMMPVPP